MSMSVEFSGIGKSYGGRRVLDGVTCSFRAGEISAVIGPNGSGKTTLLRIAARLERPDAGEVAYSAGGETLQIGLPLMRKMTYVAQRPLMFRASVYNNLAYGLKQRGLPGEEVRRRVAGALAAGGLTHLAHAQGPTLSGGEAQRAAIVRATALGADAVMLDEPASNLDPEGGVLMERLVLGMKQRGTTVVLVTHNLFQARRLADRVFFLYEGRLVESGAKEEFFAGPREELTKKFLSGDVVY